MSTSYNGWFASPNLSIRPLVVAGESFVPGILDDDDVYTVLQYVAQQMHEHVEPIVAAGWHQMDDWGFNFRLTTNDDSLSCHSSGTAIDYNATRHPYGVAASANFSPAQIDKIHEIIADLPIVWGGDYRNEVDAMHFEIMGNKAAVAAAAARIRNGMEDEMKQEDFERVRSIVRDELDRPEFVEKVAGKVQQAVWGREFSVTNANGAKATKTAGELVRTVWEILKKVNKG